MQNRRRFIKNASLGFILSDSILSQSLLPTFLKITKNDILTSLNEVHIIRDSVILNKLFVSQILNRTLQSSIEKLVISGRQIIVTEEVTFNNLDLVFVADDFQGNNNCITILPALRAESEFGQSGHDGNNVSIFAQKATGISVRLNGGDGAKGQAGKNGADAKPPPSHPLTAKLIPGVKGEKGLKGGKAGNGGNLVLTSLSSIYLESENIKLDPGNPGKGGDGGDGGASRKCRVEKITDDCTGTKEQCYVTESELQPSIRAAIGEVGETGDSSSPGSIREEIRDLEEWWLMAAKISPNWSNYRTLIGEYYFRAVNSPDLISISGLESSTKIISLSLSELNSANKLDSSNTLAKTLSQRIILLHTPLGQPRFIDLTPEFEKYRNNYTSFFNIVSQVRTIAQDYANLAIHRNGMKSILGSEITTIGALKQNIEHNLNKKIRVVKQHKLNDINERIKEDKKITELINIKKKEIENRPFGIGEFFSTVGVVVGVIGAAFTAGTSLIASAQGLMAILKTSNSMIGAFDEIKSLTDVKTVIGEFIDVSKGKIKADHTNHQKLINSALDLKGAIKNFNSETGTFKENVDIVINIGRAISQISSSTTGNQELDSLLVQKAENMRELLNTKRDLELLALDEEVAIAQIETFTAAAIQIDDQIKILQSDEVKFYVEFSIMVRRTQLYMNFLSEQIFYAIRSLEILKFEDYSDLIRYDIGYVNPDLEADLLDFRDEASAIQLLIAFNNSFTNFSNIIYLQSQYNSFIAPSYWNGYILRKEFTSSAISSFIEDPNNAKLKFLINFDETGISNKKYVMIQNVKISFIGAITKKSGNEFNAILYQSGSVTQRTDDITPAETVLEGRSVNISDVRTTKLSGDSLSVKVDHIGYDVNFGLSYRPIFGYYELSIPITEINATGLNFSQLKKIQIWLKVIYRS
ncbi:hypothetical protein [Dyadobacter psychrophilus]|uniref:Uncharacterized protein n=1 Tax=Dyadobacter psychrophilus TaxID=651661 RepID=A0A1T5BY94_9BACT|nr:hypothetical protein [Dyadobacter psychrophilus]SKB52107.1 hypothetical protein SAMN05660293_00709 [Dyadobacter psychrophilus]